jgi:hypothetical protein
VKRKRKPSGKIRVQTKPNKRFQRYSFASCVILPATAAVVTARGTKSKIDREFCTLRYFESQREKINEFLFTQQNRLFLKIPIDESTEAEYLRLLSDAGYHKTHQHYPLAMKFWKGMKSDPKKKFSFPTRDIQADIYQLERSSDQRIYENMVISLVISLIIVNAAMAGIEQQFVKRKEKHRKREIKKKQEELERQREEQRQKQLENSGTNWAQKGNVDKTPPLKPIDSSDIHLERIEERKEMTTKLEKAIRGVCGRRCSAELALSLVSLFSDSKIDSLIESPSKLAGFLINYKQRINEKLGRYGWSAEEVLGEIRSRE